MFRRFASTSAWTLPPSIRQILSSGQESASNIHVHGWVKSVRRQKNVTFAVINDGSCASGLQAVLNNNLSGTLQGLTNGASVRMTGSLVASRGLGQAKELQVESLDVLGECNPEIYPVQKQALTVEYLRDHAHLRPRTDNGASVLRLRNSLLRALHGFFERHDFCYTHTPILTSSDCEGAGETFRVTPSSGSPAYHSSEEVQPESGATDPHSEFFSKPAYLTVSSQLHLEALASSLGRVYTLSPCFRAERSQTSRHLAEFWMLEAEMAWTREVGDVCGLVEACVKDALGAGTEERALLVKGVAGYEERLKGLETASRPEPWTRITYTQAVAELEKYHASLETRSHPFRFKPKWGRGLQSEHEKWLSEELVKGPVFVTDYPSSLKPFYMRTNDDEQTVACFDLLVPHVGELVGGSLREERLDALKNRMSAHGLDLEGEDYGWYADLRRFGSAPHGGFGMGFERLVSWVSGIENVRECIAMPRWAKRMLL
ncbi:hypothetical protein HYDPIDRAFT_136994 [Hydnomerulius pinastri MD-312]|uniref:Asparagine--tRNA ligase, mitochondrial n=1 Tax=Hydnomerulius pinastri MD-312 TaxID=994086 RepID=A0A0C9VUR5_9AGAM|nr:hypothetical protein HYDPIDRAFT_137683 [Hydnomerulius pinastri MD-312]KIJ61800.1 hypothetical protein HYDPIDRAFT_136994 [Hydnomerulius pinastri MD-312]